MARPPCRTGRPRHLHRAAPLIFTPDPDRLYEVGRDGSPYTLDPRAPGADTELETRARRWWIAAVLVNSASMGFAAAAAMLGGQAVAAWVGLVPILTAPLLLMPYLVRRRGGRRARHVHRTRPTHFPPPPEHGL
ncbi:hypothetical protein [Muricoccus radiodurans]|uniref:hypothetical protein n=1 Tax=Muricoccus radiodurans TaxID=2231721 RepID=UPI003CF4802D